MKSNEIMTKSRQNHDEITTMKSRDCEIGGNAALAVRQDDLNADAHAGDQLHALGNQGNAPMVAGKNIQNQTGLTPVITMEHIGRFVRDSLGGHAAVSRSFVAKAAHPRFIISPA